MENKFQTSFIPKKSLDDGDVRAKTPISIFSLIATIAIVVSLLGAAGVFGYSLLIKKQTEDTLDLLVKKEKDFNYHDVEEIVRTDHKLQAASSLVASHIAVSHVFDFLEKNTLKNLRFNDFEFIYVSPTRISVAMKGQAKSFEAVAKQAELFASSTDQNNAKLREPIFSQVNADTQGNITFSFLSSINPSLVSYKATQNGI